MHAGFRRAAAGSLRKDCACEGRWLMECERENVCESGSRSREGS